jgi:hypothetical protein
MMIPLLMAFCRSAAFPRRMAYRSKGCLVPARCRSCFAKVGMEHARKYGTTAEQFAKVSVKNHYHSQFNPKAMYQKAASLEEVMGAEMISYPNTKLTCSVNVDGAAAIILASEKKARELGLMSRAVKIRASTLTSDPYSKRDLVMHDFNACTRLAVARAYEMAGFGTGQPRHGRTSRLFRHRRDCPLRESGPLRRRRRRRIARWRSHLQWRQNPGERVRWAPRLIPWAPRGSPICARSSPIFAAKRAHGRYRTRGSGSPMSWGSEALPRSMFWRRSNSRESLAFREATKDGLDMHCIENSR